MLYLTATAATAFSWSFGSFSLFRALTGAGIGGEYAAINSAVDELIPGRVRGHVDLGINATFWLGAALGAGASLLLLNTTWIPQTYSWRLAFGLGAAIGAAVLVLRRHVPESPRWLMVHGDPAEAERIVAGVERAIAGDPARLPPATGTLRLRCPLPRAVSRDLAGDGPSTSPPLRARLRADGDAGLLLQPPSSSPTASCSCATTTCGRSTSVST